jgi:hypothetical protein
MGGGDLQDEMKRLGFSNHYTYGIPHTGGSPQKEKCMPQKEELGSTKHDAHGKRLTAGEAAVVAATAATANACLTLYGPGVTFPINITFNPTTLAITGGSIKGDICDSGDWTVTGGSLVGGLTLNAKRTSGAGACATTITIVGTFQSPPSYKGTYGFDGSSTEFAHTTLYCCGNCP